MFHFTYRNLSPLPAGALERGLRSISFDLRLPASPAPPHLQVIACLDDLDGKPVLLLGCRLPGLAPYRPRGTPVSRVLMADRKKTMKAYLLDQNPRWIGKYSVTNPLSDLRDMHLKLTECLGFPFMELLTAHHRSSSFEVDGVQGAWIVSVPLGHIPKWMRGPRHVRMIIEDRAGLYRTAGLPADFLSPSAAPEASGGTAHEAPAESDPRSAPSEAPTAPE